MLQKTSLLFFNFGRYCHFSLSQVKDEKRQINAERIMKKIRKKLFGIILLELQNRISACFHGAGINIVFQKSIFFTFLESVT
jgi:hypothetical protein